MAVDLRKDATRLRRYLKKRIRDYSVYENLGPGNDEDAITLITVGFYLEQTGYVAVVFDTRPHADSDGQWTLHIENDTNIIPFPKWCDAFERLCDGKTVSIVLPTGEVRKLDPSIGNEGCAEVFGNVLRKMTESLRDDGSFAELPLAKGAFFVVEEFDGLFGWPPYEERKSLGHLS